MLTQLPNLQSVDFMNQFLTGTLPPDVAFPSLQEGFGLSVIEAMASGTPAVVSRIAPFTEYLGPADAFWAEPTETASIGKAFEASLDPRARASRVKRGHAVAARFDWAASARAHVAHYTAHLAAHPGPEAWSPAGFGPRHPPTARLPF